jgi:hypothetical protein
MHTDGRPYMHTYPPPFISPQHNTIHQVYYGSTHEAVKYFSSPALDFAFHKGHNPAEFVMSASQVRVRRRGCGRMDVCRVEGLSLSLSLYIYIYRSIDPLVLS